MTAGPIAIAVVLAGLALSAAAFALQVAALHLEPLAVVQHLLVTQLLCYLGLVTARRHRRPKTGLLVGAMLATAGLIAFLFLSRPTPPPAGAHIAGQSALLVGVGLILLVAAALGIGSRLRNEWRAVTLAVVCAVFYGVTALRALAIGGIGLDLFKRWELYAIAAVAPVSFLLNQNAFQSGRFGSVAVATITIADPAVSIGLGVAWLGESLASGLWWTVGRSSA